MTIAQIQHLLAYLGYYKMAVDGKWGAGSRKACEAFQRDFGLDADGIPGKDTQKALRHAVSFGMPEREDKPALPPVGLPPAGGDFPDCPNFTKAEFTCQCGCGLNNVDHTLVKVCQRVRDHFGAPFIITGPCRCQAHNEEVGGVWNSQHMYGRAVDFRIKGKTAVQVIPFVRSQPEIDYCYCIDGDCLHMELP